MNRTPPTWQVRSVAWDDDVAVQLRYAQQCEIAVRYGGPDAEPFEEPIDTSTVVATVIGLVDGVPVACGSLRDLSGTPDLRGTGGVHPDRTGEVKRVYVDPQWRGRGLSRQVVLELEHRAAQAGLRELVLESGTLQPEAMGLYLSMGYRPIEPYGKYADSPGSRCFGKSLADEGGGGGGAAGGGADGASGSDVDAASGSQAATVRVAAAVSDSGRLAVTSRSATGDSRGPDVGRVAVGIAVRDVPWADPQAVALRRDMVEQATIPLYPEFVTYLERAGGFDAYDKQAAESEIATFLAFDGDAGRADGTARAIQAGLAGVARDEWRMEDRTRLSVSLPAPEVMGCASLCRPASGNGEGTGEVIRVFVRPEMRGLGVARALMAAVEQRAKGLGLHTLVLCTGFRQFPAIRLYTSLGYRSVMPYPPNEENAVGLCFAKKLR